MSEKRLELEKHLGQEIIVDVILSILVDTFSTRAFNTQAICFKEE